WGNSWNGNFASFDDPDGGQYGTSSVGSFPAGASPYGALDMAGNASEWVADWYDSEYYQYSPYENPTGPTSGEDRILRGGSGYDDQDLLRSANRRTHVPSETMDYLGFRCSVSVEAAAELPTEPPERAETQEPSGVGSQKKNSTDGAVLMYVPAGEFEMGTEDWDEKERPVHTVYLDAFWIYQTQVTNEMFAAFVADTGYETDAEKKGSSAVHQSSGSGTGADWMHPQGPDTNLNGLDDYPVVHVSWNDAQAYCEWAGARQPTEAEWEKAARGGLSGMVYPWGADNPVCTRGAESGAHYSDCGGQAVQVGSFAPNGFGLYDMGGNVWEWVLDRYDSEYYQNSPYENPTGPSSGSSYVLRGGSWLQGSEYLRVTVRLSAGSEGSSNNVGFRCAMSAEGSPETQKITPESPLGVGSKSENQADGMVILYVPEGEFEMGSDEWDPNESPVHTVYVDAFWVYQTEVTNEMFAAFLNAEGNQSEGGNTWLNAEDGDVLIHQVGGTWQADSGHEDFPVIELTWFGAAAYCEWAGGRLPTEAEWEKAARGTTGYVYPWGNDWNSSLANAAGEEDGFPGIAPVGSFPGGASPYGALDMAGNVFEWPLDWYDSNYYQNSPYDNPKGPASGSSHALRGGSWLTEPPRCRTTIRATTGASSYSTFGFRCILPAQP
ncbi:formylglycine-generating enzyme family protein, partial [Chloroflexota bacterium]